MALESPHNPSRSLLWLVAGIAVWTLTVRAHAQGSPEPTPPKQEDRIGALEAELARQRAEIAALQASAATPPSAEPTVPAEGAAAADASSDQVAAFVASAQAEAEAANTPDATEPAIRLYGFADVGLQRIWADKAVQALESETNKLTFVLGNVNLYFDAQPSKNWRFLAEIRFGLSPDGAIARPKGGYTFGAPIDASVSDPSAPNGGFTYLKWAGVVPERVHIDWTPSDRFNLRAGLFLTPYGIWNVDHGTPTRIMVSEPLFLSSQLIPSQLLGVEAFGSFPALPWTIGYNAHVSNGRMVGQVDLTDNKAFGGRLWASTRDPFPIKLGVSGYYGTSEDQDHTAVSRTTTFAFTEYAVSGDVSIDIGPLRVRSEVVAAWTIYEPGKRRELVGVPLADTLRVGTYLMCAYQLPWLGMEPLLMVEFLRIPVPRTLPVGQGVVQPSVGLNVYFTPSTMLRSQVSIAHGFDYSDQPVATKGSLYQVVTRLITAF